MAEPSLNAVLRHVRRTADAGHGPSDGQLLARWTAGESTAFAALLERHGRLVWGVCRHVLGHEQDAEDAFQATFLVLARKAASVCKTASLASWLHGVALRVALKARARDAARRRREQRPAPPPAPPATADVTLRELQAILDEEVARLPEKLRAPFVLCCLDGRSKSEAAHVLDWKEGTVSGRLAQARERLRASLARRGVALTAALTATAIAEGTTTAAVPSALSAVTITVAAGQVSAPSAVRALCREVLWAMFARQFNGTLALLAAVAVVVMGVGWLTHPAPADERQTAPKPPAPPAAPAPVNRVDALGDKLPPGAIARLGTIRFRHEGLVEAVAWSPDGETLASGSQDQTIRLWDAATGAERERLLGHVGTVRDVAFAPDGKTLASCGQDKMVLLWDVTVPGPTKPRQFQSHAENVHSVLFLPDGKSLVSGGADGWIVAWDLASGAVRRRFGGGTDRIRKLALAADGKTLAAAHVTKEISKPQSRVVLWDLTRGEQISEVLPAQQGDISSLAFSADGETLAVGSDRGPLLREVASGAAATRLRDVPQLMYTPSVAFSPDGRTLYAGGSGFLRGWNVATGNLTRSLDVGSLYSYDLAFSPDGKTLAAATTRAVMLWDVASGKPKQPGGGHLGEVNALAFTRDGRELWTGGYDRPVYRWDVATGKEVGRLLTPKNWNPTLVLSPDGKSVLTFDNNLAVVVLDTATGKERVRFTKHLPPRITGHASMTAVFAPDGRTVVSCAEAIDAHIRIWEADTGKEVLAINTLDDPAPPAGAPPKPVGRNLTGLDVSPDGKTIWGANLRNGIRVWDATTGKELRQFGKPGEGATTITLAPDGRRLATAGKAIVIYDTATGAELATIPRPRSDRVRMVFSPDGRTLLVAGVPWTVSDVSRIAEPVRLCEVTSGQSRFEWFPHGDGIKGAAFSPDGRRIATGGNDTTALVWDVWALVQAADAGRTPPTDDRLWADLSGDAPTAFRAVARLIAEPRRALTLIANRLAPTEVRSVAKLLADLDDDDFAVREAASDALESLGPSIEPALKRALEKGDVSVEVQRRVERVLEKLGKRRGEGGAFLQTLRAVEVLEAIGTAEARKLIENIAKGPDDAEATVEAKVALRRLAKRE